MEVRSYYLQLVIEKESGTCVGYNLIIRKEEPKGSIVISEGEKAVTYNVLVDKEFLKSCLEAIEKEEGKIIT